MKTGAMQKVTNVFPGIAEVPEARFEVLVGRLLCSAMRDMLESEVFCGRPIRWREGRGLIERVFTIMGPENHVNQVKQRIDHWVRCMNNA